MQKQFLVTLEQDEDGFFVASCPMLKGCHSQGRTEEEAIRGFLASMEKHGETPPDFVLRQVAVEV